MRRVVLASGSPRRKALLESAALEVVVQVSGVDETWPGGTPAEGTVALARKKLATVAGRGGSSVAADTVVVLGDARLEKPKDAADARRMLRALSGRPHEVVTGYAVRGQGGERAAAVATRVSFRRLSEAEIELYVESGEPFDKAGAYAIQGLGGALVDRVEGSLTNVVGLPLAEVLAALEQVS